MKKLIFLVFFFIIVGCSKEPIVSETSFFVMDTYVNIKIYSNQKETDILEQTKELFVYYHQLTNRYENYENLVNVYDINRMESEFLEVDSELINLINYGIDFYDKSDGLFDIGMGNLIDVWKKHIASYDYLPLESDLKKIETNKIVIIDNKIYGDVNIDLGAIAKGYAVLKAGELLKENGFNKFIVNAGGQVLVGERYRKTPYKVGIKNPDETGNMLVLNVENLNVSTSGSYERFFEIDGIRYNHIINPKTLFPANYFKSVSVVANDSLLADVLTTILFLMPIEDGLEFISNYQAEAIWYTNNNEIVKSEGFSYE